MKSNFVQRAGLHAKSIDGFSLVELVIALAVVSLTFIGIIGLLGLGLINDQTSSDQTVSTNIAGSIITDLRSTPSGAAHSTIYNLTMPTSVSGTPTTPLGGVAPTLLYFDVAGNSLASSTGAVYVARVYLAQVVSVGPSSSSSLAQSSDIVRVAVSWPAAATTAPAGTVDLVTQFNVH